MTTEEIEHLAIDGADDNVATSQPHTEVNDRPNQQPERQGWIAERAKILDELVEVRADRLLAKADAGLVEKEGRETAAIMSSCRRHLGAATNDNGNEIIPSSA